MGDYVGDYKDDSVKGAGAWVITWVITKMTQSKGLVNG